MVQAVHRFVTETYPKIEDMYSESIDVKRLEWEGLKIEISGSEAKQIEAFRKHLEAAAAEQNWSMWNQGVQYLGSFASIGLGLQCLAVPGGYETGVAWIAAGVTGLTHRTVSDLGGWKALSQLITTEKERQKRIEDGIDLTLSGAQLGLTLSPALFAKALLQQPQMVDTAARLAQKGATFFAAFLRVGQAKAQARTADQRKVLDLAESHKSILRQNLIESAQHLNNDFQPAIERSVRNLAANNYS